MPTPRRRTNTLIVDGEPYNWRASRRAIMVEHAEQQRGRVREFLNGPDSVDAGRVVQLIRHACSRGWRPTKDDDVFEIETSTVWDDPRTRDHYQWMRVMTPQFRNLERFFGSAIEVGAYWWHGTHMTPLGGFGARLRFSSYQSVPEADLWEAAFCVTGTEGEHAYADIFAMPFAQGQNIVIDEKRIRTFWLKQDCERIDGVWRDSGWQDWERPDQWSHASVPGQIFFALDSLTPEVEAAEGEPIELRFQLSKPALAPLTESIRVALHHVSEATRGELLPVMDGTRWISWDERDATEHDRTTTSVLVSVDISTFSTPWAWDKGEYLVEVRLRRERSDGQGQSDISKPVKVVIR